jgi:phage terminase small subunit
MALTKRQKLFCERLMQTRQYRSGTDAYISVYKPKGSRRTAMASASRIRNRPAVQAYIQQLRNEQWNEW